MIDVTGVKRLGGHVLEIAFSDGTVGARDFAEIKTRTGEMVAPLRDADYFARVFIERRAHLAQRLRLGPDRAARRDEGEGPATSSRCRGVNGDCEYAKRFTVTRSNHRRHRSSHR
jgi:hypothetical protein